MASYLPIETNESHVTFVESGWSVHDFRARLKTEDFGDEYSHDVIIEAVFQFDGDRGEDAFGCARNLPSIDLQLDFNQSHITPIRLGLGAEARISEDEVIPFRLEVPLYDVKSDLDADEMKLTALSLGYSSGTHYHRNMNGATYDERMEVPAMLLDRSLRDRGFKVLAQPVCYWKPEEYEDDVAEVQASFVGTVRFESSSNIAREQYVGTGGDGGTADSGGSGAPRARGITRIEHTLNVVLDLRGPDDILLGSETFKMFPYAIVESNGTLVGGFFHFQIEHGFDVPLEMIEGVSLVVSVYGK